LRKSIVGAVCDHDLRLAPMLIGAVEAASTLSLPQLDEIALTQIGRFCTQTLEAELPVTHQTKRQGSPHKLILTKTAELFNRDAKRRKAAQASLGTVQRLLGTVER
jgi:hypothetical protein